jgi:hypothetical protein
VKRLKLVRPLSLEIARATLECARSDIDAESERARALDGKLTGIAQLSGLALSIGASVGASVLVGGGLSRGYAIALGAVLSTASLLLLAAASVALSGLSPKGFEGVSLAAARDRVDDERLRLEPADAIAELAATYAVGMLPQARATNKVKVTRARHAYWLVGCGLGGLVLGLVLTSVAAVT